MSKLSQQWCSVCCFSALFLLPVFTYSAASEPPITRQQALSNMLKHDCGACHGLTLQGGLGPSLLAQQLQEKSDIFLITTIREGRKGTAMPPWKKFITQDEAQWLVNKLRQN